MDIEIQAKEIMYHKANLNRIMAECTGQPIEKVRAHAARLAPASSLHTHEGCTSTPLVALALILGLLQLCMWGAQPVL